MYFHFVTLICITSIYHICEYYEPNSLSTNWNLSENKTRLKRETQGAFCVLNANAKSQTRKSMKINVICTVPYKTHCKLLPILMSDHDIQTQLLLRFSEFTVMYFVIIIIWFIYTLYAQVSCHSDVSFASNNCLIWYYTNKNEMLSKSDININLNLYMLK